MVVTGNQNYIYVNFTYVSSLAKTSNKLKSHHLDAYIEITQS